MAPERRASRRGREVVPPSDSVEEPLTSSSPVSHSKFKGVYVPQLSSVSNSESSLTSSPALSKSHSPAAYDTPATSVTVTPAQSIASMSRRGKSRAAKTKTTAMVQVQNIDDTSEDAKLALSLQAEEYEENTSTKDKRGGAGRKGRGRVAELESGETIVLDSDSSLATSKRRGAAGKGKGKGRLTELEPGETIILSSDSSRTTKQTGKQAKTIENDTELVLRLQEEEWSRNVGNNKRSKRTIKKEQIVKDSTDDSESALSSVDSEDQKFKESEFDEDDSDAEPLSLKRKRSLTTTGGRAKRLRGVRQALQMKTEPDLAQTDEHEVQDSNMATPNLEAGSAAEEEFAYESLPDSTEEEDNADPTALTGGQVPPVGRRGLTRNQRRAQGFGSRRANRERVRLEATHPEIVTMWDDLAAIPKIPTEEAEQPLDISRKLKGFQLEGLNWMRKQEQTSWKGGLLGDEMGMGKTIQAVSLIMSDFPAKSPTIVVVPPVALMQWTNEINDYTNGKLKVLIFHGTNAKAKNMSVKELKSHNVILISYSSLESIYRKEIKGWNRGEHTIKEDSAIHHIHYHRIILDEAHSIKGRTTGVAKACFALQGDYRWCLSGTPVQNRIGEFFSLLRFLKASPYANYFCKSCPCSTLHWTVDQHYRCTDCKHRALDHVSVFNQEILNPITTGGDADVRRDATKKAFQKLRLITDRVMLRRIKNDQTASMELPPKEVFIHNEFFGEIESDFAASIMGSNTRKFDTYVSHGVMLDNYANIFGLIMQMRQVADHPDLILKKNAPDADRTVLVCQICDEPAEDAIRSRCRHEFCRECARDYVKNCEGNEITAECPRCHIPLTIDLDQPEIEQDQEQVKKSSIINRIKMENWTSSTKIEMLVYDLWKMRSKKQTIKSIVFSQFTSMLQLIEWRLRRAGFNTVMLDGSMSPMQRQKSIEYFMNNTDVEVFLVSLKAGGVALNLTEASRVFIVDPWWNPAAEWQSADRCHRIGQKRPCVITRLCVEDSIESRIVMLQEKKAHMINGTVNNDDVAMEKLTPQDMTFLFRGS